jgi:hypothetical protein
LRKCHLSHREIAIVQYSDSLAVGQRGPSQSSPNSRRYPRSELSRP